MLAFDFYYNWWLLKEPFLRIVETKLSAGIRISVMENSASMMPSKIISLIGPHLNSGPNVDFHWMLQSALYSWLFPFTMESYLSVIFYHNSTFVRKKHVELFVCSEAQSSTHSIFVFSIRCLTLLE